MTKIPISDQKSEYWSKIGISSKNPNICEIQIFKLYPKLTNLINIAKSDQNRPSIKIPFELWNMNFNFPLKIFFGNLRRSNNYETVSNTIWFFTFCRNFERFSVGNVISKTHGSSLTVPAVESTRTCTLVTFLGCSIFGHLFIHFI